MDHTNDKNGNKHNDNNTMNNVRGYAMRNYD